MKSSYLKKLPPAFTMASFCYQNSCRPSPRCPSTGWPSPPHDLGYQGGDSNVGGLFLSLLQDAANLAAQSVTYCGQAARTCSIVMSMQHEHGHAAWEWTCSTDMDMQHGHGHAAWTWTCSMGTGMQHEHGHAAWTWACSMDMDMQHGFGHDAGWSLLHHSSSNEFHRNFSFTFTVLPAQWPPMMAVLTFSSSFIWSNNCPLKFLLQEQRSNVGRVKFSVCNDDI